MGRYWGIWLGVLVWVLGVVAPAGASIPSGNLVANPGAEAGSASSDGLDVYTPPGWSRYPGQSPRATVVAYGAGDFPTLAQSAVLGGGRGFFAGGPSAAGDDNSQAYSVAVLTETLVVPPEAEADVDAGNVQATMTGCLGGQDHPGRSGDPAVRPPQ